MHHEIYLDEELAFLLKLIFDDYYEIRILVVDGSAVFLRTKTDIFEVDLQAKRLCDVYEIEAFYPYKSFYRRGSTLYAHMDHVVLFTKCFLFAEGTLVVCRVFCIQHSSKAIVCRVFFMGHSPQRLFFFLSDRRKALAKPSDT